MYSTLSFACRKNKLAKCSEMHESECKASF